MRYVDEDNTSGGYTPEEVMIANGLLSLLAMGLEHRTDTLAIHTDADLRKDELAFKIKKQEQENNLAIEKLAFDLTNKKLDKSVKALETLDQQFYEKTGKRYVQPEEHLTKAGTKLQEDHKKREGTRLQQIIQDSRSELKDNERRIKNIRGKIQQIDPVINWVGKHYNKANAGDPNIYEPADYSATVDAAKEHFNINPDDSYYLNAALDLGGYPSMKLEELNADLRALDQKNAKYDEYKHSLLGTKLREANSTATDISTLFTREQGGESQMTESIRKYMLAELDKGNNTMFSSGNNPGITVTNKQDIDKYLADIVDMAMLTSYYGFEGRLMRDPWIKVAIDTAVPGIFQDYDRIKRDVQRLSLNLVNNNLNKTNNNNIEPVNNKVPPPTLDSEGTIPSIMEGIVW